MCCCAKPNKNGEPGYSWDGVNVGVHPASGPTLLESETLLFDEPGRCRPKIAGKGDIDYHSHHFRIVGARHGEFRLLVRHGGGDERIDLGYSARRMADFAAMMPDSDARYLFMHMLYSVSQDAASVARNDENEKWRQAAAEKRIRTRKVRGMGRVKVWIEPKQGGN
jgi:hypothetical protein